MFEGKEGGREGKVEKGVCCDEVVLEFEFEFELKLEILRTNVLRWASGLASPANWSASQFLPETEAGAEEPPAEESSLLLHPTTSRAHHPPSSSSLPLSVVSGAMHLLPLAKR